MTGDYFFGEQPAQASLPLTSNQNNNLDPLLLAEMYANNIHSLLSGLQQHPPPRMYAPSAYQLMLPAGLAAANLNPLQGPLALPPMIPEYALLTPNNSLVAHQSTMALGTGPWVAPGMHGHTTLTSFDSMLAPRTLGACSNTDLELAVSTKVTSTRPKQPRASAFKAVTKNEPEKAPQASDSDLSKLTIYVKSKIPSGIQHECLELKRAGARYRAARKRQKVADIAAKAASKRSAQEEAFLRKHEATRVRKNALGHQQALDVAAKVQAILSKPESQRTVLETLFLARQEAKKKRKNQGDKLRRQRLKQMGLDGRSTLPLGGVSARGPLSPQAQGMVDMQHPNSKTNLGQTTMTQSRWKGSVE